jgi:eukaryotic-like serine/threonine-protein kinase
MPLSAGDKLGPYEIVAPIGAGGMGEVHRGQEMAVFDKIMPPRVPPLRQTGTVRGLVVFLES